MLKIMGAALVIIPFALLGYLVARGYGQRVRELTNLQSAFQMLETEILYGLTPLPEAFDHLARRLPEPAAGLFGQARAGLELRLPIGEAWQRAVADLAERTSLNAEDLEMLSYFSYGLGEADTHEQQKKFRLLGEQLEAAIAQAVASRNKNQRMWQYLGLAAGIAVALLLI